MRDHFLSAIAMIVAAGAAASPARGAELVPPGTLRATFIAANDRALSASNVAPPRAEQVR
jgi:hypothetical protein